jgi:AFG3 family protein
MDDAARIMVDEAYQRTLDLLMDKKEELVKVAELLKEKETITHDDVVDLIGARPFAADKQYQEYISNRNVINDDAAAAEAEEGEEEEKKEEGEEEGGVPPLGLI